MAEIMITLKDIATEAEVSVMTVSNVINKNYTKVSKETIEKVNAIIKKRNYIPNLSARSLSGKKSNIVAIIIQSETSPTNLMDDPYQQSMIGYMELYLRKNGYFAMLRTVSSEKEVISMFHNWNIAGAVMFYPRFSENKMEAIIKTNVPVVVIDRFYEHLDVLTVDLDDYRGGYLSGRFMLLNGHRRIGFACPYTVPSLVVKNRIKGFADALNEYSLRLTSDLFFNADGTYEAGIEIGKKISAMKSPPTAVSTTLDRLALGIQEGLRLSGLSVPHDVSIIGFDNWPVLQYVQPKITTIAQDFAKKSEIITSLLIKEMTGEEIENRHITLGVELIERQSVRNLGR